jgi:tetratricopeptide (TPR) repeat protein
MVIIVLIFIGVLIALYFWLKIPSQAKKSEKKIEKIEKKVEDISKETKKLKIYIDGLTKAKDEVRIAFEQGQKAITENKWDEAIAHFQAALKKAAGIQFVALFNLIGFCYYTSGGLKEALVNFEDSACLAEQLNNKEAKAIALDNIGIIYQAKGDLNKSLKYLNQALETYKRIGAKREIENVENHIRTIEEQIKQKSNKK